MKECTKCGEVKELTEYYFRKDRGCYHNVCTPCRSQQHKEARDRRLTKAEQATIDREYQINYKYGITGSDYTKMLEDQNNCCAICNINQEHVRHQRLYIDHDHDTGAVRELLCNPCNAALGLFNDSSKFVQNAANYLKRFNK